MNNLWLIKGVPKTKLCNLVKLLHCKLDYNPTTTSGVKVCKNLVSKLNNRKKSGNRKLNDNIVYRNAIKVKISKFDR